MKEKYTPGEGCVCHAHSEAECGCDVDWTPREVYELRERALANEAIATWKKTREERDAALIGYNECRATIEDARRALGATAHEGLLLAAMRVTEQRDRLAVALRELCETLLKDKPRDITDLLNKAGDALAAVKG